MLAVNRLTPVMNLSVNGHSQVPPGFRFHPTEEELLHYYLRKKVASEEIDLDVIRDVDLNKLEPWDIQEKCKIGSTPQNDWYFFSHKDKKYPTGTRTNRATTAGFWKATGRDKVIYSSLRRIGMRKTLVFYTGRAPHGQKSEWIMHEYRLEENNADNTNVSDSLSEDGWVVCRVFHKKKYQKGLEYPKNSFTGSRNHLIDSSKDQDEVLDHILLYMGRNCKEEHENIFTDGYMHLPRLHSPSFDPLSIDEMHMNEISDPSPATTTTTTSHASGTNAELNDWGTLDRLVASQLNGHVLNEPSRQLSFFSDPNMPTFTNLSSDQHDNADQSSRQLRVITASEIDLWSFTRPCSSSSSDPLSHLSI